jgi:hypothetical protein
VSVAGLSHVSPPPRRARSDAPYQLARLAFIGSCLGALQKSAVMPVSWAVSAFPLSAFRFFICVHLWQKQFPSTILPSSCSMKTAIFPHVLWHFWPE